MECQVLFSLKNYKMILEYRLLQNFLALSQFMAYMNNEAKDGSATWNSTLKATVVHQLFCDVSGSRRTSHPFEKMSFGSSLFIFGINDLFQLTRPCILSYLLTVFKRSSEKKIEKIIKHLCAE